jgi:hypothetical protein
VLLLLPHRQMGTPTIIAGTAALVSAYAFITALAWDRLREPYMDEEFHVAQTQQCAYGVAAQLAASRALR